MNVLDIFSGIGGFSLGLERAGMRTVAFCEIDKYCRRILAKHWPHIKCYDDVRELTSNRLLADGIAVDLICGGFPCQDISVAGAGAGIKGERSSLWREFARLIGEVRPRYAIVENVSALLGRGLGDVLGDLAALGYNTEWHCIPASYISAPHQRDRIWILGYPEYNGCAAVPEFRCNEAAGNEWRQKKQEATWKSSGTGQPTYVPGVQYGQCRSKQEDVANSECKGLEERDCAGMGQSKKHPEFKPFYGEEFWKFGCEGGTPWAVITKFRGVFNGISERLDGGGLSGATEITRPGEVLRFMRQKDDKKDLQRNAREYERVSPQEILQSNLHVTCENARNADTVRNTEARHEVFEAELRTMRSNKEPLYPSHGWELAEQRAREFTDALHELSYEIASYTGRPYTKEAGAAMLCLREALVSIGALQHPSDAVQEAWKSLSGEEKDWAELAARRGCWVKEWPSVPRVTCGIPNRADRLRGLGNAVVPQIPEIIGRIIMAWEAANDNATNDNNA